MRVKRSVGALKKRREVMRAAKGYRGQASRSYRVAKEAVMKAENYAYIGRKLRKRDMRKLWIVRINAACRENNISYSRFIDGLKKANITLDRKSLAEVANSDKASFAKLVEQAKAAL